MENTVTNQFKTEQRTVTDPSPLGIDTSTEFSQQVSVYDHGNSHSLKNQIRFYDEDPENNISMGDVEKKAEAAFELIQKSQAVLIEVEPWFVNKHMGTTDFDRWEPFCVGFPEVAQGRQMKFSNMAPLSEITYRLSQRDTFLNATEETDYDVEPVVKAQIEEQKAFTRYTLDSFYNGEPGESGAWIDMSPIHAIHTCLSPWPQHLIIGSTDSGSLYCGRGALFDEHVDVAIDLDRRINEYGERKVAVYNDIGNKEALNSLDFEDTHARYIGEKARWEVDMNAVETIVTKLLSHSSVEYVSVHRMTEKAYLTHVNSEFASQISGYPGFE